MAKEAVKKKEEEAPEEKEEKKEEAGEEKEEKGEGEEGEGGEGEGTPAPKKSKKKMIIIGAILLLLLAAAGGGAFYYFVVMKKESAASGEFSDSKAVEKRVFYTLPEFLVNLNTGGKQSSFLKTTIVLELESKTDVLTVEANLPRVFDTMNTYLRELRASDLAGSAGLQRLREELLLRANQALAPMKVNDVLFKEMVVQ